MNSKFFNSLFKKETKKTNLHPHNSILVNKLKLLCKQNNYLIYENITLYHRDDHIFISFMILDPFRGIYLLEDKSWDYNELNSHKIEKRPNAQKSKDSLSYENTSNFIQKKIDEVIHNYSINIFNFLLTQNLSLANYEHLEDEKKTLLPSEKIIFNNTNDDEILSKLKSVKNESFHMPDTEILMASLLTQFLILDLDGSVKLASDEQQKFILNRDYDVESLDGLSLSGKTSALMLKSILLKLEDRNTSVTIIEPTTLSCDLVKASLMNLVEYSIVSVDITSVSVITPQKFKESQVISDYILCDDSNLLEEEFLDYLLSIKNRSKISLINSKHEVDINFKLTNKFQKHDLKIEFIKSNPLAKLVKLLLEYTKLEKSKKILIICNNTTKPSILKCLNVSLKEKMVVLDSSKKIIDQDSSSIFLSDINSINAQRADIIIILDIYELSQDELGYAINLANEKVYLIYELECDNINTLKTIFKQ
ncbi:MAG: hypothetical protein L3I99_04555 [Sulfurimonas sp.]|nr:hypothetical protein [Sulfurimonas sp.]